MDCNKEEAFRARAIAEKKMQAKDFAGARKAALKAKQLFPEIESISQILIVCEVHYCAEKKIHGLEDWYGILQVLPTADATSIKQQYWKLLYQLLPIRNNFAGAEHALKLVEKAYTILSVQATRSQYDANREASSRKIVVEQSSSESEKNLDGRAQPQIPRPVNAKIQSTTKNQCPPHLIGWKYQKKLQEIHVHAGSDRSLFYGIKYQRHRSIVNGNFYHKYFSKAEDKNQVKNDSGSRKNKLKLEAVKGGEYAVNDSGDPKCTKATGTVRACGQGQHA